MVAALHLFSIEVSGWKAISHEKPVMIDFRDENGIGQSCLITGPNEIGKSSTFSALRYALFEIFNRGGQATQNWVNNDTLNAGQEARVFVELMINGEAYSIEKTRKGNGTGGTSKLFIGLGEQKVLLMQGKQADEKILELVGARNERKQTEENPAAWGLLAWLLAPQGMDSIVPAREGGIDTLGLDRSVDIEGNQLLKEINESLNGVLTEIRREPMGEFKSKKELNDSLANGVKVLENQMEEFSIWLEQVTRLEVSLQQASNRAKEASEAWDEFNKIGGVEEDRQSVKEKQRLLMLKEFQQTEADIAENVICKMKEIEKNLKNASNVVTKLTKEEAVATESKQKELDKQRRNNSIIEKIKGDLNSKRETLKGYQKELESAKILQEYSGLLSTLESVENAEGQLQELSKGGEIVDEEGIFSMTSLSKELLITESVLSIQRNSSIWNVKVDDGFDAEIYIDGKHHSHETDGIPLLHDLNIITSDDKKLVVQNTATDSDENYIVKHRRLLDKLESLGFESIIHLDEAILNQTNRLNEFRRLNEVILQHPSSLEIKSKIDSLIEKLPSKPVTTSVELLEKEISKLNHEIEELHESLETNEQLWNAQEVALINSRRDVETLTRQREVAKGLIKVYDEQRIKAVEEYGALDTCVRKHKDILKKLEETSRLLKQIEDSEEVQKSTRKSEHLRLEKNKSVAEKDLRDIQIDLSELKNSLERAYAEDLSSKLHDMYDSYHNNTRELQMYEQSVRARDTLSNRIRMKLTEATKIEITPIREKVQTWLHAVTEGKWTDVEFNERLEVLKIGGPMDSFLPGEQAGSHGLQQVIHALIRLAVATHIYDSSKEENPNFPPVTIVMDESQGSVDRNRVSLLMEQFNRAISEGKIQVIAISHRGDEFRSLHPVVEYDMKRKKIIDYSGDLN